MVVVLVLYGLLYGLLCTPRMDGGDVCWRWPMVHPKNGAESGDSVRRRQVDVREMDARGGSEAKRCWRVRIAGMGANKRLSAMTDGRPKAQPL